MSRKSVKKKQTKADFLRSWGLPPTQWLRYTGIKGVYWCYFSRFVRERDYLLYGGLCMTCGEYVEKGSDQAGHLFPAKNCGFALLFHPLNVHLQHSKCNNPHFTPNAGVYNAYNIDKRYPKILDELLAIKAQGINKEWKRSEYEEKIKALPTYQQTL